MTFNDCLANVISNIEYAHKHMSDFLFDEFVAEILKEISNYTDPESFVYVDYEDGYEDEDGTSL